MLLLRVLKSTYELFDKTDVIRNAQSTFRNAAALVMSQRLIDSAGAVRTVPIFLGSGFSPSADGASQLVTLKPGLALWYDSAAGDVWAGNVKPVFSDTEQTVAFSTNTDGSGDDRIDTLAVRPLEIEEDEQLRTFVDPTDDTTYQKNAMQRTRHGFEFKVYVGTPDPAPSAPAVESGYFKIAEVTRVNAQANVNAVDVSDSRVLDRSRAGFFEAFSGLVTRAGALYFGDPDGDHYRLERDSDTSPTVLNLKNQAGSYSDFKAGDLIANVLRSRSGTDTVSIRNTADDDYGRVVHKLGARAWAYLRFDTGTWVVDHGEGVGAVVDVDTGQWDLAISPALDSTEAIAVVSAQNSLAAQKLNAIVDAANNVAIEVRDNTGTLADPASGTRIAVVVYGGF